MRRKGALDGIRGVALVAVLAYHAGWLRGGWLGVDIFFVLSGYLLTSILLGEHERTGRIDWQSYATRRIRRLAPAIAALGLGLVLLAPHVAAGDAHRLPGDLMAAAVGVMNWHLIADNTSYFESLGRPSLLRHAWSLGVEIQFYALCPVLVTWLARQRTRVAVGATVAGIAASSGAMALLYRPVDPSRAYYGTDARIGALLVGVLVAVLLARGFYARVPPAVTGASAVGLLVLLVLGDDTSRLTYPAGFLISEGLVAVILVAALQRGVARTALNAVPLKWLGERSYGIYLWHWPLVVLLRPGLDVTWPRAVTTAVAMAGAVALGAASYAFVERPFLRRPRERQWWTNSARWAAAGAALAGIGVLAADLPRADPIVASIRAGEELVAAQRAPAPPPPVTATTATTTAATTTTSPPVAVVRSPSRPISTARPRPPAPAPAPRLSPGPPPGSVSVAAIGDSVMLGAAKPLQARLGSSGYIDADASRQFSEGARVAARLRSQGRLGEVVVVHLGTNGPPRGRDVDALMGELGGVPHVVFLTVRMPRRWEGESNAAIRGIPSRYGNARIADWYAHSGGHPEYFHSDGVHLTARGAQAYADLVGSALPPPPPPPPPPETTTTLPPETTTTTAPPQDVLVP